MNRPIRDPQSAIRNGVRWRTPQDPDLRDAWDALYLAVYGEPPPAAAQNQRAEPAKGDGS